MKEITLFNKSRAITSSLSNSLLFPIFFFTFNFRELDAFFRRVLECYAA